MAINGNRGLILAAASAMALLMLTLWAYRPPAPVTDATATEFSATRAKSLLKNLVGDDVPHPMGSAANVVLRDRIVRELQRLGYSTELQTGLVCSNRGSCGWPTNIIATRGDIRATPQKDAVLLAAHYDSVPAGPGASDDGVGVASILDIAQILTQAAPTDHPIILLLTDGEEAGLLGAQLFTREHPLSKQVKAAVNLEARGVSGPSLMFETGTANAWLMRLYAATIARPITNSLNYVVYKSLPNDTDFTIFKTRYQGFNFALIGDIGHYHTPLDSYANASAASIQHQGDNALRAILALANSSEINPPPSEAVFFDVMARALVVLPAPLALPAALVMLAILLAETIPLFRRGLLSGRQWMWGTVGIFTSIILGALLSAGCIVLLEALGKLPPLDAGPWLAHSLAMNVATAALPLLTACVVCAWFSRRAGFWGFWLAAALLVSVLAVIVSALVPGASFVLLLTSLALIIAPLPSLQNLRSGTISVGAADFAALLPGLTMVAALLPLLLLLYTALGALAWPICAITLCLATSLWLPLLGQATLLARRSVIVLAAVLSVGGLLATLVLPTYSNSWPQRLNVEYWFDADNDHAHWWIWAASKHLPSSMLSIASFEPAPRPRFPGYPQLGFFADAQKLAMAGPALEVISAAPSAQGRTHYELKIRSLREAAIGFVIFPAAAAVQEIVVATQVGPQHTKLRELPGGATAFCLEFIAEGLQFGIDAKSVPVAIQFFDQSYGLPEALAQGKALLESRPLNATSSQDGDVTVVQRTVRLNPAAGR
jgi:Peptidase family M28